MKDLIFLNPAFFWLFVLFPLIIFFYFWKDKKNKPALKISVFRGFGKIRPSLRQRFRHLPFLLRLLTLSLFIVALARPNTFSAKKSVQTEGIDIIMAIDVSTSMEAEDFHPNRLEAAKKTAMDFIDARNNDRIGLVLFAAESFTQCPITIDHNILKGLFKSIKTKMLEDGTAIGMGLSTAVNRLKDSKAESKVIILLTDGVNNTGKIAPLTAADIAQSYGIRVYTIGVGTKGKAPFLTDTPFGKQYVYFDVEIDEELLRNIAHKTGGEYFRATGNKALENIYSNIDRLEKTKIDESIYKRYNDEFFPFLLAAVALLLLEFLTDRLLFNRLN